MAEAALCGGPPCAASVVQRDRSRTNNMLAADCFGRISIRFRASIFVAKLNTREIGQSDKVNGDRDAPKTVRRPKTAIR
jgi:hypothetical protein